MAGCFQNGDELLGSIGGGVEEGSGFNIQTILWTSQQGLCSMELAVGFRNLKKLREHEIWPFIF